MMTDEELAVQSLAAMRAPIGQMCKAINAWAESLAKALEPIVNAVVDICQILHDEWWRAYSEAGLPFGDSDDGMYAWLDAMSKAHALRLGADEIESRLEWMADWRRKTKALR